MGFICIECRKSKWVILKRCELHCPWKGGASVLNTSFCCFHSCEPREEMGSSKELLLIVSIFLAIISNSSAFRSDELQDDEEWGLVGGRSAESDIARPPKFPRSSTAGHSDVFSTASDSKLNISLEHAFGYSDFSPAGYLTARLKPSPHGGQTLTKLRLTRNSLTESEQKVFEVSKCFTQSKTLLLQWLSVECIPLHLIL